METMIAGIADRLRKKKSLEYWKKSQMREVIEDYYRRNGDIYNCEMLQHKKMIPEIKESFDTGVFYADRNELTDVSLYEKEFGYPLPEEIAAYINCCWHGYICGFLKNYPGVAELFPVCQEEGKTCNDILYHHMYGIITVDRAWRKHKGYNKRYIPIGFQYINQDTVQLILYERETKKIYLEDWKTPCSEYVGVAEERKIADSLEDFIKGLCIVPYIRTGRNIDENASMRKSIEDYYLRTGDIYNCEMLRHEKMIPEIQESFDAGIFYTDRRELTDVTLYEKELGYPLPEEIEAYINCCWHGYICGVSPECPGVVELFPVYQKKGKNCNDILYQDVDGIITMTKAWIRNKGLKGFIPIGAQYDYNLQRGKMSIKSYVLYERGTGRIYLEEIVGRIVGERKIAGSLKELIRGLQRLPDIDQERDIDENASMREVIEDYYKRLKGRYLSSNREEHMKAIPKIREAFAKEIYCVDREEQTDLSLYEKEFGYPLPEEVAEYVNCCWHSYITGYYKGDRKSRRCITLCAAFQKEGENCNELLYEWKGIIGITKEWEEEGGDVQRYIGIGWLHEFEEYEEYVFYDRETGGIYCELRDEGESCDDINSISSGLVEEKPIASSLKDFILHLN